MTVEKLVKTFGEAPALHDVSLDIAGGELIALLGPSGSGKTTLLRVIAGLEFPTSGRVLIGGEDASLKSVQERNVGFVFQHYALFKHMKVFDNVAFGLRVRPRINRLPESEIRSRVLALLDLMQLSGMEKRYPSQLSGGQRQRVALARALAIAPSLLLLDEPFGALDAKVRKELRRWLREIHDRTHHTTIFVTHDQEEALELADRVVVMNNGRIEQAGSADDIYDRPATPFVFDFVGESSHLPVTVEGGTIVLEGERLGIRADAWEGEAATLFFRPNHAVVSTEPVDGALMGVVNGARRVGDIRRLEIALGQGDIAIEADAPADADLKRGDRVSVAIKKWKLFDR